MRSRHERHPRWRRAGSSIVASALAVGLLLVAPAHGDTGNPPEFLRNLGGPLHAEMYPSGMEVGPDGTIVIADTGNDQIAKYTKHGRELWRIGRPGGGRNRFSDPRDIGIDSRGRIYVADARNKRIVKLSSDGRWLKAFKGPGMGIPIGVTVRDDVVYVADSSSSQRIRTFHLAGDQIRGFTDPNSGPCDLSAPRDADADPQGNIYIANYTLHNVVKISPSGDCLGQWATGTITSNTPYGIKLAKDPILGKRLVYVALGNEDTIEVYQLNGSPVGTFGGNGLATDPGKFTELRRVAVAADGDVWGADLWGWRLERFNRTGTGWQYAERIGDPLPPSTRRHVFHQPHQITFEADGRLAVMDTVHHRIVRMSATGQIVSECGTRGGSAPGQFNWPRGVAVDPVTGYLWVANTKQNNIHVMRVDTQPCRGAPVAQPRFGTPGSGPDQFNWPHAIVIRPNPSDPPSRIAFIADTLNHRIVSYAVATRTPIVAFGTKGEGNNQFNEPTAVALGPDGHLFVADSRNKRIVELEISDDGASFTWVDTYTNGFKGPQGVAVDPQGRIFVADTGHDRLVVLRVNGTELATVTGLSNPESVAVDPSTGRIYVSDTFADRVRVYEAYAA